MKKMTRVTTVTTVHTPCLIKCVRTVTITLRVSTVTLPKTMRASTTQRMKNKKWNSQTIYTVTSVMVLPPQAELH